jgi:hypothetical protein
MHIQIAAISCPAVFQQSILRIFMQTLSFLFIIRFFALLQQHLTDCGYSMSKIGTVLQIYKLDIGTAQLT